MVEAHLELAREMLPAALAWQRDGPPRAPIAGDELAAEVGIEPGPELGELLARARGRGVHRRGDQRRRRDPGRARVPRRREVALARTSIGWTAMSDCIFCAIVAGELPAEIVDSDEHTVAFMDINPATRGHALVIPRTHSADLLEISDADLEQHDARRAAAGASECERVLEPDGFNLLNACRPAAWQTVFHFHIHVVPRYEDDPLKLPWIRPAAPTTTRSRRSPRRSGEGELSRERRRSRSSGTATSPRSCSTTRRSTCSPSDAFDAMIGCLDEVEGSDARALVWRAEGEVFTGGVDVSGFQRVRRGRAGGRGELSRSR